MPSLLMQPEAQAACNRDGRHTIFERIGGLTVLGHWHPKSVQSKPHDHGRTWAIYGVVTGKTAMYEYEVVEPPKNKQKGKVKLVKSYWIMPGQAFWYPTGAIHSHKTYEDSKLIRLEGFNLWRKELNPGGHRYIMV